MKTFEFEIPLKRIFNLIQRPKEWEEISDTEGGCYHSRHPEFTIVCNHSLERLDFDEPWVHEFPNNQFYKSVIKLKCHGTTLRRFFMVCCDGDKYRTIQPEVIYFKITPKLIEQYSFLKDADPLWGISSYYLIEYSEDFSINTFFQFFFRNLIRAPFFSDFSVFKDEEAAKEELELVLDNNSIEKTFYYQDKLTGEFSAFSKQGKRDLFYSPKVKTIKKNNFENIHAEERALKTLEHIRKSILGKNNHPIKTQVQKIAKNFWNLEPNLRASELMNKKTFKEKVQALAKAFESKPISPETIRKWLREIDPRPPSVKPGPRSK